MIANLFLVGCVVAMGLLLIWNDSEHRKTIARQHKLIADQEVIMAMLSEMNRDLRQAGRCKEIWEEIVDEN